MSLPSLANLTPKTSENTPSRQIATDWDPVRDRIYELTDPWYILPMRLWHTTDWVDEAVAAQPTHNNEQIESMTAISGFLEWADKRNWSPDLERRIIELLHVANERSSIANAEHVGYWKNMITLIVKYSQARANGTAAKWTGDMVEMYERWGSRKGAWGMWSSKAGKKK
jgi:hypothetical protein